MAKIFRNIVASGRRRKARNFGIARAIWVENLFGKLQRLCNKSDRTKFSCFFSPLLASLGHFY
ncbi:hypothetical protein [[Phormidium ambiguum] IAM M-71]|uniref:hypothetical protein n=1 Tax=[Phormidium ambiguum] IAM M-71 TaxID=454136 RepID=UPI001C4A11DC|nr:hypothetical protein [Phormidium ambiguum]